MIGFNQASLAVAVQASVPPPLLLIRMDCGSGAAPFVDVNCRLAGVVAMADAAGEATMILMPSLPVLALTAMLTSPDKPAGSLAVID